MTHCEFNIAQFYVVGFLLASKLTSDHLYERASKIIVITTIINI